MQLRLCRRCGFGQLLDNTDAYRMQCCVCVVGVSLSPILLTAGGASEQKPCGVTSPERTNV